MVRKGVSLRVQSQYSTLSHLNYESVYMILTLRKAKLQSVGGKKF